MEHSPDPDVVLHDETDADQPFLVALHRAVILQALGAAGADDDPVTTSLADMQLLARGRAYAAAWPAARRRTAWIGPDRVGAIITNQGPDGVHVVDLAVAPSRRRRGVGRVMLDRVVAEADGAGVETTARILVSNTASLALFAGAGFEGEGRTGDAQITVRRSQICDSRTSLRPPGD